MQRSHLCKMGAYAIFFGVADNKSIGLDVRLHRYLVPVSYFDEHRSKWDLCFHICPIKNNLCVELAKDRLAAYYLISKIYNLFFELGGGEASVIQPVQDDEPSINCANKRICKGQCMLLVSGCGFFCIDMIVCTCPCPRTFPNANVRFHSKIERVGYA